MIENGYELALFDGLNRFYAKAEDTETLDALKIPASIFDQFVQYRWWKELGPDARAKLEELGYPNPSGPSA